MLRLLSSESDRDAEALEALSSPPSVPDADDRGLADTAYHPIRAGASARAEAAVERRYLDSASL
jgi:hypothetical protein